MADGIKKLGPGRWQVRVSRIDRKTGHPVDVKRIVEGTKAEAERVREELLAEFRAGGPRQRVRLGAFASSWIASRHGTVKPSVSRRYAMALDHHILPALGDYYLDTIEPGDVQRYVTERLNAGAAANTVNNELRTLRTMARDAVAAGHSPRNWTERVKAAPVAGYTEDDPNLLTTTQLAALLAAVPRQWSALVHLLATTGLRWGEASALRWEDVTIDRDAATLQAQEKPWDVVGTIKIRRSNWRGEIVTPKTTRSHRTVPLLREVVALLGPPAGRQGLLFPGRSGQPHRGYPLRSVLDRAAIAAGIAHRKPDGTIGGARITPHGLRRTWNNLARQRADRQIVQAITGHTTDAMTEHYSLVGADEKARLASSVRAALESAAGAAIAALEPAAGAAIAAEVDADGVVWEVLSGGGRRRLGRIA